MSSGALAQKLTIGIGGSPASLGLHFHDASPGIGLTQHAFDRLAEQDAQARPRCRSGRRTGPVQGWREATKRSSQWIV